MGVKNKKQELTFAEILAQAPPTIKAYAAVGSLGGMNVTLKSKVGDQEYKNVPYINRRAYISGDGSSRRPYEYRVTAGVSLHYAIVNLWFLFHPKTKDTQERCFIRVNDFVFLCTNQGVRAWTQNDWLIGRKHRLVRLLPKK